MPQGYMLMLPASPENPERKGVTASGLELWASKHLELRWLPCCDNWHNPSLHEVLLAPDKLTTSPRTGVRWFWRVDKAFVAWAVRAIGRADQARAELPHDTISGFQVIRSYLEEIEPGGLATLPLPGALPGSEILKQSAEFARLGIGPRWEGWERFVTDEPPKEPIPAVKQSWAKAKSSVKRYPSDEDERPKLF